MKRAFFAMLIVSAIAMSRPAQAAQMLVCDLVGPTRAALRACKAVGDLVSYASNPVGYHTILVDQAKQALDEAKAEGVQGTEMLRIMLPFYAAQARLAHANRLIFAITAYKPEMESYVFRLYMEIRAAEKDGLDTSAARERLTKLLDEASKSPRHTLTS